MTVAAARKAAEALSGRIAGGHIETGKRHALTFSEAFDDYCQYLLKKATAAQKEPLWHRVVTGLGKLYLKPQWDGWTLAEISRAPKAVQEWHEDVSKRAGCQSAPNRDPGSASKRDPTFLRFERLALAPSELVGVAETTRARVGA